MLRKFVHADDSHPFHTTLSPQKCGYGMDNTITCRGNSNFGLEINRVTGVRNTSWSSLSFFILNASSYAHSSPLSPQYCSCNKPFTPPEFAVGHDAYIDCTEYVSSLITVLVRTKPDVLGQGTLSNLIRHSPHLCIPLAPYPSQERFRPHSM